MDYRKIIQLGDSSYVVSMPRKWIEENKLKKGDIVVIQEEDSNIIIRLEEQKTVEKPKEIVIEFGDMRDFQEKFTYAYISNYNTIKIEGTKLKKILPKIKEFLNSFVALELVYSDDTSIIIKDYLDMKNISMDETLRRIDRLIKSMAGTAEECLKNPSKKLLDEIEAREVDINKFTNLSFKVLKKSFVGADRSSLKIGVDNVFYYWEMVTILEKIGDYIKRTPRNLKFKVDPKLIELYNKTIVLYNLAIKSHFTKDTKLALDVDARKRSLFRECDTYFLKCTKKDIYILQRIREISSSLGALTKILLRLHYN